MKERFKEAMKRILGGWFFPEIAELEGRLKVCHQRMQEMYWDEKAKDMAKGTIAMMDADVINLVKELRRVDPDNEVAGTFLLCEEVSENLRSYLRVEQVRNVVEARGTMR